MNVHVCELYDKTNHIWICNKNTVKFLHSSDPCEEGNSITMDVKEDRSTSCKEKSLSMCDNSLKNGWYRIQRNGVDMKMPTTCVDQYSCGTVSPIWLSGMFYLQHV